MQIACLQTNPQENVLENIQYLFNQVRPAKTQGAHIVVFPEMFSYMGLEENRKNTKSNLHQDVFLEVENLAKELGLFIIAGSHSETIAGNPSKVYNTSVAYSPQGNTLNVYQKMHLFNLKDPQGNSIYCESDSFAQGNTCSTFDIEFEQETWKAQTIICYDLRFPEIIHHGKTPLDILFVPAAFTWQTGKDHWEVLLRARAIENQCYVVACNQTGEFLQGQKRNYGNSMIIDPWGHIIARLGEECGIVSGMLTKNTIAQSRLRLPALTDRRL